MVAELISVGTEILLGNIVNTNAAYLAEKCALLGLSLYHQSVVGDNEARMEDTIRRALERSDVVILTGGLGPTKDDLTKEVTAKVFKKALCEDAHTKERIMEFFQKIHNGEKITENNWKQALIPEGAIIVENQNGTAPGLIVIGDEGSGYEGKRAILIPGPPNECIPMFETQIAPYLSDLQPEGIYSSMVKVCAIGESRAETMVADLMDAQTNPTLAPYAKTGEVHFRVTAKAKDEESAKCLMAPMLEELKKRFGHHIYTTKEEVTLEEAVIQMLEERKMTVTTAESCTGGLLCGRLVNVPGASSVLNEAHITYSNEAKERILHVPHEILKQYGAVSEETARAMAEGACRLSGADASIAVTGIAGPEGGTPEKPVGLVYIGCMVKGRTKVEKFRFTGNRQKNREYAVARALILLRECLLAADR